MKKMMVIKTGKVETLHHCADCSPAVTEEELQEAKYAAIPMYGSAGQAIRAGWVEKWDSAAADLIWLCPEHSGE